MNNLIQAFYIGFGGFLGAISRWLVSKTTSGWLGAFPLGTLLVNVIGSLILGFVMYSVSYGKTISPEFRNFSTMGFIGAFTTMSTFSYETVRLFELKDYGLFSVNFVTNVVLCLAAILAGRYLAMVLFK